MIQKMIVLGATMILSFVFCQVSEAVNLKAGIIGKWVEVYSNGSYGEQIEFLKDGTVIVIEAGEGISHAGNYKFIGDNRLRIDIMGTGTMVFEVSIDKQGKLILTDPVGKVETYIEWKKAANTMAVRSIVRSMINDARNARTIMEALFVDCNSYVMTANTHGTGKVNFITTATGCPDNPVWLDLGKDNTLDVTTATTTDWTITITNPGVNTGPLIITSGGSCTWAAGGSCN